MSKANPEDYIQIDTENLPITGLRQTDSVGVFICPICLKRWYIGGTLLELFRDLEQQMGVDGVYPRHKDCNTIMIIYRLPDGLPPPVGVDDLERIVFRTKIAPGHWENANAKDATDAQFEAWISLKLDIGGEPGVWLPEERAGVCDIVLQRGELAMLAKNIIKKDEEKQ